MQEQGKVNKEYLAQDGIPEFFNAALTLMLGENSTPVKEGRNVTVQVLYPVHDILVIIL